MRVPLVFTVKYKTRSSAEDEEGSDEMEVGLASEE